MDQGEGGSGLIIPTEATQTPLISGLPDDIAFLCLARVPRRHHAVLNCVSRRWRDLVGSDEFYSYRMKHNLHAMLIFVLCYEICDRVCLYVFDPNSSTRSWKRIDLPPRVSRRKGLGFEVLGKKVYLLGGSSGGENTTNEAYCFDTSLNTWFEVSPMTMRRCFFACEVMDGKIYAVGGLGLDSQSLELNADVAKSWDIYDPSADSWESHSHPDASIFSEIRDSFVMNGKIYIQCRSTLASMSPNKQLGLTLQENEEDIEAGLPGPTVVVEGELYALDETLGITLTMWCKKSRKWVGVGRLSTLVTKPPCLLSSVGNKIFVIGKGFSIVVIDVGSLRSTLDKVMLGSSTPGFSDADTEAIICKCVLA